MTPQRGRVIACLGLALAAGSTRAQQRIEIMPADPNPGAQDIARPGASNRVVRAFDFEELSTNPGEVPAHWFRAQDDPSRPRPGFPAWNRAELRYTGEGGIAFAGSGAVELPTSGGSTSLLLAQGVVPVFQNADFLCSALVKTSKLRHARAALVARFLDARGQLLPNAESRSQLVLSEKAWTPITVELIGGAENAAYIQLELQLLQPQQQGEAPDPSRVWPQDFEGSAWFDNVSVVQLPRIELTTSAAANITSQPETPTLKLLVRDLTGEPLRAKIEVVDAHGRPADRFEQALGSGFTQMDWSPRVSRLGWYRAIMHVTTDKGASVGQASIDFLWTGRGPETTITGVPESILTSDLARLGLEFEHAPASLLTVIPTTARQISAGSVALPVWHAVSTFEQSKASTARLTPTIDALLSDRRRVTLVLGDLPDSLAASTRADPRNPWSLLATDNKSWQPYLTPLMERYGQRITHWQIGDSHDALTPSASLSTDLQAIARNLTALVPAPVVGVPTPLGAPWSATTDPHVPVSLTQHIPATATPQAVSLAVRAAGPMLDSGAGELRLVLAPHDTANVGPLAAAAQAAKSAIEFWAAASQPDGRMLPGASLSLADPLQLRGQRRQSILPRPELGAWHNLAQRLAGRRITGTFAAGPGITCYVLSPAPGTTAERGGALVAWSESADPVTLTGDFGRGALTTIDLFGNRELLQPAASLATADHPGVNLPLTSAPLFIEGVDINLIRFTSSIAIDPPTLESSNEQHDREVVIFNPWPTGITGQFTFLEPGGFETGRKDRTWRLSPRAQSFSVGPGKTERFPFKVAFSPVEEVGPKPFVLAFELSGQDYGTIEVRRSVEVTVDNIGVDLTATIQGPDLIIEGTFSNRGTSPLTLELTCFAEGFPRSKATITDLPQRNNVVRRFTYPGAAAKLKGQRIMVTAYDPETKARVNKSVVVP